MTDISLDHVEISLIQVIIELHAQTYQIAEYFIIIFTTERLLLKYF